jgi:hypothetical protein
MSEGQCGSAAATTSAAELADGAGNGSTAALCDALAEGTGTELGTRGLAEPDTTALAELGPATEPCAEDAPWPVGADSPHAISSA